jgi:hypothetical protein
MRIVLGVFLRHYRFEPHGDLPSPKRYSILIGPDNTCPATIYHREENPLPQ